ncbi:outer membrane protein assembly factor BamB [Streptomyces canus]|uniref:serine/threonine-protein kinase n=1 Tax=Streptomyces canus TaxID=58343 RepID=UPI002789FECB|nr:serine/threonine-protein kinase [Streptomyces canus]MDQ0602448.1 outer membrane protein assembly factor BamB [Streptomyces canus]
MQVLRATDPRRIGPYEVRGRLGSGGMGEVYLAESRAGLRLAVKVVRSEYAQDRTFRARFRQEVRAAQTVGGTGTYTARVVDADPEGEHPWMATEFVEGPNLRDAVLDGGPLPEPAVRVLAAALGEALGAIHAKGMVHRDLKPSNILLAPDGPRVIDFGIVRALEATAMTRTGAIVGSVGYVSPEQIRNGGQVGPPSDVFALGAVLAYAASGREPFGEGQDSVILLRVLTRDFDLKGVPDGLLPLVESCLRDEPAERPTPEAVIGAVGHTAGTLRESVRSGWFRGASAESVAVKGDERWLPQGESGERESRVEYVAPVTATDTPVPDAVVPDVPAETVVPAPPPSRRGLLKALTGGAVVAAGGGVGGWLWLRDSGDKGGATGGGPTAPDKASGSGKPGAKVRWRYSAARPSASQGPLGAVSPDGKVLYVPMADGTLRAISADGKELWKHDFGDIATLTVSNPVVTSDGLYTVVSDVEAGAPVSSLLALNPGGTGRWKKSIPSGGYVTGPVLVGDLVAVGYAVADLEGAGEIRAYDAGGESPWKTGLQGSPHAELLVADDILYAPSFDNHLHALAGADGSELWKAKLNGDVDRPAVTGGVVAVGTGDAAGTLFGIGADGRRVWAEKGLGSAVVTAGGSDDVAFLGIEPEGQVLVAIGKDGQRVWKYRPGDFFSEPVPAGDLIYLLTTTQVHVLTRAGKLSHKVEVGALQYGTAAPVLHGNRLYTASSEGITALDVTA